MFNFIEKVELIFQNSTITLSWSSGFLVLSDDDSAIKCKPEAKNVGVGESQKIGLIYRFTGSARLQETSQRSSSPWYVARLADELYLTHASLGFHPLNEK